MSSIYDAFTNWKGGGGGGGLRCGGSGEDKEDEEDEEEDDVSEEEEECGVAAAGHFPLFRISCPTLAMSLQDMCCPPPADMLPPPM